jgi:hypothetical protein
MGLTNNFNPTPDDPDLQDLIAEADRSTKLSLNCHAIGVILSFNKTIQTAVVQITYTRVSYEDPQSEQIYIPVQTPYPPLMQCPVVFLGGGGSNLQFPVAAGDECLIEFNDRDLDSWWHSGGTSVALNSLRLHDMADAVVMVGPRSQPKAIKNFDGSRVVLAGIDSPTGALLGVSPTVASLENGGPLGTKVAASTKAIVQVNSVTLGTPLSQLMAQITELNSSLATFAAACAGTTSDPVLKSAAIALEVPLAAIAAVLPTITTSLGNILA